MAKAKPMPRRKLTDVGPLGRFLFPVPVLRGAAFDFEGYAGAAVKTSPAPTAVVGRFRLRARLEFARGAEAREGAAAAAAGPPGANPPAPSGGPPADLPPRLRGLDPVDWLFDRPFLLALRRSPTSPPYFLMWIGNADVLEKGP